MQGETLNKLAEYIVNNTPFSRLDQVSYREYGPSDYPLAAYIRPEGDQSGRDYYREDDYIVGRYVLVGEVKEDSDALLQAAKAIENFPGAIGYWQEASKASDVIYLQETGEKLTANCHYVMIRFELKTPYDCTVIC